MLSLAAAAPAGQEGPIDFLHHILDSREWETPFGTVHFPPPGTWQVGPVDLTPTKHTLFLALSGLLVILVVMLAARQAERAGAGRLGGKAHGALEALVLFLRNDVVMANIGRGGEKYAPFVVTLFFFILFANLLGLVPWGATATANISVTAALAALAFLVIEGSGLVKLGPAGYLGTIFHRPPGMGPIGGWLLAIALAPIEFVGKLTKPFALAIRLMANMTAGHIVLLAVVSLILTFGISLAIAPVGMAVAITFLEIFVAFLQAYIFSLLTSVFIGLITHHH